MKWLQTTLALVQFAPSLLQLIVSVEALFPKGAGAAKKAIVMASVASSGAAVAESAGVFVDATVKQLNAAGVFHHAPEPPAAK